MTNEEIIRYACTLFNDKLGQALPDALGSVIAFCINIKDHQFKEYLEKKLESIRDCYQKSKTEYKKDYCSTQMVVIAEIINELFPNTEQDESDNDE